MRELKLRYFIDLASNIGAKAKADAQAMEQAQKAMQGAITGTNTRLTNWNTVTARNTKSTTELRNALTGTTSKFDALDRVISRVGTNTSTERQIGYMRRLSASIDQAESRATRLRTALANGVERAPEMAAAVAAGGYAARRVTAPFINNYSNLESATTDLRVAMLDKNGQVSKDFETIAAEAKKLGEKLPGGTKDFMLAARALIEQAVPPSVIAGGGLRAASNFGAVVGMDQYQAATTVAKVREAHGLKDDELVPAADLMQRGRFGFGITPTDYLEVAKYAAPTYNAMKLTGVEQMKELLAIQGLAAQVGIEASSFGTNYSQMLVRTAQVDSRTNRNSKEAKEVKALLAEHDIQMEFFNKEGEWAGNRNMVAQLEKLKPLSTQDKIKVSNRLFGVEAGRPALRLADGGVAGFDKALSTIDGQASLDQRVELKMQSFAARLEALGGVIENVTAQIATQLGEKSKPIMDRAGEIISGPVQGFFERNPTAGTAGMAGLAAGSAYLGGRLGGGLLKSLILRGAPAAAGTVAGGAAGAGAAGGAASATAVASGASKAAGMARGLAGLNPLMLIEMLTGPSEEDIAKLYEMDRQKAGYRGQGFKDPRLLGAAPGATAAKPEGAPVMPSLTTGLNRLGIPQVDMLTARPAPAVASPMAPPAWRGPDAGGAVRPDFISLTAPGAAPTSLKAGQQTEVKVGEGRISLDVRVSDERVRVLPMVTQQPSLVRIDAGGTNPGGFGR